MIMESLCKLTMQRFLFRVIVSSFFISILWSSESGVRADSSLSESVLQAQCRGSCLLKFTTIGQSRDAQCKKTPDCYLCWDACRLMQGGSPAKTSLCSDKSACFPGCQTACQFYQFLPSQNLTPPLLGDMLPPLAGYMSAPKLTGEGQLVWDTPVLPEGSFAPGDRGVIMYIIMTHVGGRWLQHIQTSLNRIQISKEVQNSRIRLLAVSSSGLVAHSELIQRNETDATTIAPPTVAKSVSGTTKSNKFFYPENKKVDHPLAFSNEENEDINVSPIREDFRREEESVFSQDYVDVDSQPPSVTVRVDHSWEVTLSLKSIDLIASVEVTWDVRGSGPVDYMLTWTEGSGGISGHLMSKQNKADVSLWKGQQYLVQVELLDSYGNTVLRSVPKSISFSPKNSTTTIKKPKPPKIFTRRPIITTTTTEEPLKNIAYPQEDFMSAPHLKDVTPFIFSRAPETSDWSNDDRTPEIEEELPATVETSWTLLAWAVCLGSGAVVLLILIAVALRTLRRGGSNRQEISRTQEDFLSETTASTSTSATRCSSTSRPPNEDQWTYESVYGVGPPCQPSHQAYFHPQHRHPPPPIPLSAPPPPLHLHHHHHPPVTPIRIDNASMIENYILTLDPSPVVKRVPPY